MNADPVPVSEFVESKPRTSVTPAGSKGDGGLRAQTKNAHTDLHPTIPIMYPASCILYPVS